MLGFFLRRTLRDVPARSSPCSSSAKQGNAVIPAVMCVSHSSVRSLAVQSHGCSESRSQKWANHPRAPLVLRNVLLAIMMAICSAAPASAGVIHGYAWFAFGSWDFSDSLLVGEYDGDLSIVYVVDPPLGYVYGCWNGASARIVSGSFEDVVEAPADLATYDAHGPALLGPVYVLRTAEGHYVKYHMIQVLPAPLIEYV